MLTHTATLLLPARYADTALRLIDLQSVQPLHSDATPFSIARHRAVSLALSAPLATVSCLGGGAIIAAPSLCHAQAHCGVRLWCCRRRRQRSVHAVTSSSLSTASLPQGLDSLEERQIGAQIPPPPLHPSYSLFGAVPPAAFALVTAPHWRPKLQHGASAVGSLSSHMPPVTLCRV